MKRKQDLIKHSIFVTKKSSKMTIPNQPTTNQAPCSLDLLPANQLVVEPICSWRLSAPYLEVKVSNDGESIRYSVYNHHPGIRRYWPNSASSSIHLTSVFMHCIWQGIEGEKESRLFSDKKKAALLSVDLITKKIGVKEWTNFNDFLITRNPINPIINEDNSLEFQEEIREIPRNRPYDLDAEEGITRWRRTEEGALILHEGEPMSEKTIKVWSGDRDIRLIKYTHKSQERILCRSFNWATKENPEAPCRFAPGSEPPLPNTSANIDTVVQCMKRYTPQLENIANEELVTFYRQHPLKYFMPDHVLSRTRAIDVQRWVYQQFYRKEGENIERFEYTNFVSVKEVIFSFGKKGQQEELANSLGIEAWHVEMKRQAGWVLQLPIGVLDFFSGIFLASAQNPPEADKKAMKRLVQGIPMIDTERNKTIDDFAIELGACSIIHFYMAWDRSVSQLEINGRVWVRNFGNAGRGVRGTIVSTAERLAAVLGQVGIGDINRGLENAAQLAENAERARIAWEGFRGRRAPPQANPAN